MLSTNSTAQWIRLAPASNPKQNIFVFSKLNGLNLTELELLLIIVKLCKRTNIENKTKEAEVDRV